MIERQNVVTGILASWDVANALDIAETIANPSPIGINEEFRDLILDSAVSYPAVYARGLQLSHYNFLLTDYSYFQFSWTSPNHVRYAYYPNPFALKADDRDNISSWRDELDLELITYEEYLDLLMSLGPDHRAPVIRYENAPDQYRSFSHPCSHFHFGFHSDNRWASSRILTPLAFSLLIFKGYYGHQWRKLGADDGDPFLNKYESRMAKERAMACRIIGDDLFSQFESQSFHFG